VATSSRTERVDWAQVRLIFATNWKTWLNRWSNKPIRLVLNVLALMMFVGFAAVASVGLGFFVANLRATGNLVAAGAAVHWTFLFVLVILAATPVLGFRGNEFLDVTKLFGLPVGHRTVFAATLCCLMASLSVFLFAMPIVGVSIGYGWNAPAGTTITCLAAGFLLVLFAVTAGQFLLLVFLNTLKSRKWRDVSTILLTLVGGVGIAFQFVARQGMMNRGSIVAGLEWFSSWKDWTAPLPSWWAANAATGEGFIRFLPLAALVAVVAWLVRAAADLEERAFFGEVEEGPAADMATGRGPIGRVASRIKDPLGALVEKDLALLRREPVVRSLLIGGAMYPIMWLVIGGMQVKGHDLHDFARYAPFVGVISYGLLLMEMGLLMNQLGIEGGGAVHALLLPVPRSTLVMGKNVAFLLAFGTLNALIVVAATIGMWLVTSHGAFGECALWCGLGALEAYCVLAIGLAAGDVVSVASPIRIAVKDRRAIRQQMSGRDGCMHSLIRLVSFTLILGFAGPILVLFHGPYAWAMKSGRAPLPSWTMFATVPVAVAFAWLALYLGAKCGGALLASREEQVAAQLTKSEE